MWNAPPVVEAIPIHSPVDHGAEGFPLLPMHDRVCNDRTLPDTNPVDVCILPLVDVIFPIAAVNGPTWYFTICLNRIYSAYCITMK